MRISDWSSDVCSSDLDAENRRDIGLRRFGKPIARHDSPRVVRDETVEGSVQIGIVHLDERAAIERIQPRLDLRAQELDLQLLRLEALLQAAYGVAHRHARVPVLAGADGPPHQRVLARKSDASGKGAPVRVDPGGRPNLKK